MRGAIFLILVCCTTLPAWATDYYFDPVAGSDSNNCQSVGAACQTDTKVQTLLDTANPGDNFLFKRGTTMPVSPTLKIDQGRHGTQALPITINAYSTGGKPILDGTTISGLPPLYCTNTNWWNIRNIHFTGTKGLLFQGCKDFEITDNVFDGAFTNEVLRLKKTSTTYSERGLVARNDFHPADGSECIYMGTDILQDGGVADLTQSIIVEDNEFHADGLQACGETIEMKAGVQNITIQRNYIHDIVHGTNGIIFSSLGTSGYPPGNHLVRYNWIENITGTQAWGIRIRNHATIRGNIVLDASQAGILLSDPSNADPVRLTELNTLYSHTGAGISDTGGDNDTTQNNISWANGSGNDASDPLFVNTAAGNFRLQAGSPSLTKGALRALTINAATIQTDGTSMLVAATPAVSPIQACTTAASSFALTCSPSGSQTAVSCLISSATQVTLGLAMPVPQGATCTLAVTAGALLDDARIGGQFRTAISATNSGTNYAVTALAVTNNSTTGSGGETAANLLTLANMVPGTCTACAPGNPWSALLDLDTTTAPGSAGNSSTSFQGEHDLGSSQQLGEFRAFCDALGSWQTQHVTVEYKVTAGATYTVGIDHQACAVNNWTSYDLGSVPGRYIRITFFCETSCGGTEAREIFLQAADEVAPTPGARSVVLRGVSLRGGIIR